MEFIRTDTFLIILLCINIILVIGYAINTIRLSNLRKGYKKFMSKLGKGADISEDLKGYIQRVENVEEKTHEVATYCKNLDLHMTSCIQKIGMVRYSAFKDTGSDLSFALALLNEGNSGVVLNGIYSREMSNIYAKPVDNGVSKYTLSQEEKEAIAKAINYKRV